MDKERIKEDISSIIEEIKKKSVDAEGVGRLLDELIVKQKELDIVPLNTYDVGKEIARKDGDAFYVSINEKGAIVHLYNNIEYLVNLTNRPVMELLNYFVNGKIDDETIMDEDIKEVYDMAVKAFIDILNVPLLTASDMSFLFTISAETLKYINVKVAEAFKEPLKEEDKEEVYNSFKETVLAMEEISKDAKRLN